MPSRVSRGGRRSGWKEEKSSWIFKVYLSKAQFKKAFSSFSIFKSFKFWFLFKHILLKTFKALNFGFGISCQMLILTQNEQWNGSSFDWTSWILLNLNLFWDSIKHKLNISSFNLSCFAFESCFFFELLKSFNPKPNRSCSKTALDTKHFSLLVHPFNRDKGLISFESSFFL